MSLVLRLTLWVKMSSHANLIENLNSSHLYLPWASIFHLLFLIWPHGGTKSQIYSQSVTVLQRTYLWHVNQCRLTIWFIFHLPTDLVQKLIKKSNLDTISVGGKCCGDHKMMSAAALCNHLHDPFGIISWLRMRAPAADWKQDTWGKCQSPVTDLLRPHLWWLTLLVQPLI